VADVTLFNMIVTGVFGWLVQHGVAAPEKWKGITLPIFGGIKIIGAGKDAKDPSVNVVNFLVLEFKADSQGDLLQQIATTGYMTMYSPEMWGFAVGIYFLGPVLRPLLQGMPGLGSIMQAVVKGGEAIQAVPGSFMRRFLGFIYEEGVQEFLPHVIFGAFAGKNSGMLSDILAEMYDKTPDFNMSNINLSEMSGLSQSDLNNVQTHFSLVGAAAEQYGVGSSQYQQAINTALQYLGGLNNNNLSGLQDFLKGIMSGGIEGTSAQIVSKLTAALIVSSVTNNGEFGIGNLSRDRNSWAINAVSAFLETASNEQGLQGQGTSQLDLATQFTWAVGAAISLFGSNKNGNLNDIKINEIFTQGQSLLSAVVSLFGSKGIGSLTVNVNNSIQYAMLSHLAFILAKIMEVTNTQNVLGVFDNQVKNISQDKGLGKIYSAKFAQTYVGALALQEAVSFAKQFDSAKTAEERKIVMDKFAKAVSSVTAYLRALFDAGELSDAQKMQESFIESIQALYGSALVAVIKSIDIQEDGKPDVASLANLGSSELYKALGELGKAVSLSKVLLSASAKMDKQNSLDKLLQTFKTIEVRIKVACYLMASETKAKQEVELNAESARSPPALSQEQSQSPVIKKVKLSQRLANTLKAVREAIKTKADNFGLKLSLNSKGRLEYIVSQLGDPNIQQFTVQTLFGERTLTRGEVVALVLMHFEGRIQELEQSASERKDDALLKGLAQIRQLSIAGASDAVIGFILTARAKSEYITEIPKNLKQYFDKKTSPNSWEANYRAVGNYMREVVIRTLAREIGMTQQPDSFQSSEGIRFENEVAKRLESTKGLKDYTKNTNTQLLEIVLANGGDLTSEVIFRAALAYNASLAMHKGQFLYGVQNLSSLLLTDNGWGQIGSGAGKTLTFGLPLYLRGLQAAVQGNGRIVMNVVTMEQLTEQNAIALQGVLQYLDAEVYALFQANPQAKIREGLEKLGVHVATTEDYDITKKILSGKVGEKGRVKLVVVDNSTLNFSYLSSFQREETERLPNIYYAIIDEADLVLGLQSGNLFINAAAAMLLNKRQLDKVYLADRVASKFIEAGTGRELVYKLAEEGADQGTAQGNAYPFFRFDRNTGTGKNYLTLTREGQEAAGLLYDAIIEANPTIEMGTRNEFIQLVQKDLEQRVCKVKNRNYVQITQKDSNTGREQEVIMLLEHGITNAQTNQRESEFGHTFMELINGLREVRGDSNTLAQLDAGSFYGHVVENMAGASGTLDSDATKYELNKGYRADLGRFFTAPYNLPKIKTEKYIFVTSDDGKYNELVIEIAEQLKKGSYRLPILQIVRDGDQAIALYEQLIKAQEAGYIPIEVNICVVTGKSSKDDFDKAMAASSQPGSVIIADEYVGRGTDWMIAQLKNILFNEAGKTDDTLETILNSIASDRLPELLAKIGLTGVDAKDAAATKTAVLNYVRDLVSKLEGLRETKDPTQNHGTLRNALIQQIEELVGIIGDAAEAAQQERIALVHNKLAMRWEGLDLMQELSITEEQTLQVEGRSGRADEVRNVTKVISTQENGRDVLDILEVGFMKSRRGLWARIIGNKLAYGRAMSIIREYNKLKQEGKDVSEYEGESGKLMQIFTEAQGIIAREGANERVKQLSYNKAKFNAWQKFIKAKNQLFKNDQGFRVRLARAIIRQAIEAYEKSKDENRLQTLKDTLEQSFRGEIVADGHRGIDLTQITDSNVGQLEDAIVGLIYSFDLFGRSSSLFEERDIDDAIGKIWGDSLDKQNEMERSSRGLLGSIIFKIRLSRYISNLLRNLESNLSKGMVSEVTNRIEESAKSSESAGLGEIFSTIGTTLSGILTKQAKDSRVPKVNVNRNGIIKTLQTLASRIVSRIFGPMASSYLMSYDGQEALSLISDAAKGTPSRTIQYVQYQTEAPAIELAARESRLAVDLGEVAASKPAATEEAPLTTPAVKETPVAVKPTVQKKHGITFIYLPPEDETNTYGSVNSAEVFTALADTGYGTDAISYDVNSPIVIIKGEPTEDMISELSGVQAPSDGQVRIITLSRKDGKIVQGTYELSQSAVDEVLADRNWLIGVGQSKAEVDNEVEGLVGGNLNLTVIGNHRVLSILTPEGQRVVRDLGIASEQNPEFIEALEIALAIKNGTPIDKKTKQSDVYKKYFSGLKPGQIRVNSKGWILVGDSNQVDIGDSVTASAGTIFMPGAKVAQGRIGNQVVVGSGIYGYLEAGDFSVVEHVDGTNGYRHYKSAGEFTKTIEDPERVTVGSRQKLTDTFEVDFFGNTVVRRDIEPIEAGIQKAVPAIYLAPSAAWQKLKDKISPLQLVGMGGFIAISALIIAGTLPAIGALTIILGLISGTLLIKGKEIQKALQQAGKDFKPGMKALVASIPWTNAGKHKKAIDKAEKDFKGVAQSIPIRFLAPKLSELDTNDPEVTPVIIGILSEILGADVDLSKLEPVKIKALALEHRKLLAQKLVERVQKGLSDNTLDTKQAEKV